MNPAAKSMNESRLNSNVMTTAAGWRSPAARGYLLAAISVSAALALRLALDPLWGERLPYVTFFLAELIVMRFAGTGPLVATGVAGFALADWCFMSPRHSLLLAGRVNQINALFFVLISVVLWFLSYRTRRALAREQQAMAQLRQNAAELAQLAAIVESSDDAIIGNSLDGTVTSWNAGAERLYGYSAAEAVGQSMDMLMPAGTQKDLPELLERVARGDRIRHFETERQTRDGRTISVSLTISPLRDPGGSIIGTSTIARDISERKQAEAERERLLQELQTALANVKTLRGLLPICANCKKIRDDKGYWNQIEYYIRERSEADFTHGICPDCAQRLYGEVLSSGTKT